MTNAADRDESPSLDFLHGASEQQVETDNDPPPWTMPADKRPAEAKPASSGDWPWVSGQTSEPETLGQSDTAKKLEQSGAIDDLALRKALMDHETKKSSRDKSLGGWLGSAGLLNPEEAARAAQEELKTARDNQAWWKDTKAAYDARRAQAAASGEEADRSFRAGLEDGDRTVYDAISTAAAYDPLAAVGRWGVDELSRKMGKNIKDAKDREIAAQAIIDGKKDPFVQSIWRNMADRTGQGIVDDIAASSIKSFGYALGMAEYGMGLSKSSTDNVVYAAGDAISKWAKATFPGDEARQYEWSSKIAQGAGSAIGFFGPALGAKVIAQAGPRAVYMATAGRYGSAVTTAESAARASVIAGEVGGITGAMSQSASMADDYTEKMQKEGKPINEGTRLGLLIAGLPIGYTEKLSIDSMFSRQGGSVVRGMLEQIIEEGGQEFVQQVLENVAVNRLYDPERHWDDNAWEGMAVGGILGGAMGGGAGIYEKWKGEPVGKAGLVSDQKSKSSSSSTDSPAGNAVTNADKAIAPAGVEGASTPPAVTGEVSEVARQLMEEARAVDPEFAAEIEKQIGGTQEAKVRVKTKTDESPAGAEREVMPMLDGEQPAAPVGPGISVQTSGNPEPPRIPDEVLEALRQTHPELAKRYDERHAEKPDTNISTTSLMYGRQPGQEGSPEKLAKELAKYGPDDLRKIAKANGLDVTEDGREVAKVDDADLAAAIVSATARKQRVRTATAVLKAEPQAAPETPDTIEREASIADALPATAADVDQYLEDSGRMGESLSDDEYRQITGMVLDGTDLDDAVEQTISARVSPEVETTAAPKVERENSRSNDESRQVTDSAKEMQPDERGYRSFVEMLAGTTPSAKWAATMGVDQAAIDGYVQQALLDGRLAMVGGKPRRTPKAKLGLDTQPAVTEVEGVPPPAPAKVAVPAGPTLTRAEEKRLEAVKDDLSYAYAKRLLDVQADAAQFGEVLQAIAGDKRVNKERLKQLFRAYTGSRTAPKTRPKAVSLMAALRDERAKIAEKKANAERSRVRESEGSVPQGIVPSDQGSDAVEGNLTDAPADGGQGRTGDVRGSDSADAEQGRPADRVSREGDGAQSDTGSGAGDRERGSDTRAPDLGLTPEQRAEIQAKADADADAYEAKRQSRMVDNYTITDADKIGQGGAKAKVRGNLEAIRIIRQIEQEGGRPATAEEKAKLVKYVGWGAFAQDVFTDYKSEWAKERNELKDLLSPEEYAAARASVTNAHYTSPEVIKGMWDAMKHIGFEGGRVLEPSAGIGHFIGLMPESMKADTDWTAVELDKISGAITKALYGAADVRVGGFEDQLWPDDHFDLAISNVPFDKTGPHDPRYKTKFSLHDYFFIKALDKVRPGGIVAFITSNFTLDKQRDTARREMEKRATFLGAIRLPGGSKGAFKANAGTDVTTDIIFLRKRIEGEPVETGAPWTTLEEIKTPEGPAKINGYFAANPEMMLGKMRLTGSMYARNQPVLIGSTEGIENKIVNAATDHIPAGSMIPRGIAAVDMVRDDIDTQTDGIKEGSFYEKDGQIYRKIVGVGVPQKLNKQDQARVRAFMPIRDNITTMLAKQASGDKAGMDDLRADLNKAYDAFVKQFGPINLANVTETTRKDGKVITTRRLPNFSVLMDDTDAYTVSAIEVYDEKTGKAIKAAIFNEDIVAPYVRPAVNDPADAIGVSLNEKGRVDLPTIATTLGVSEAEAIAALGDKIFLNPKGERWQTRAQYLSGDVVTKLEEAKAAASTNPSYARNVAALEDVQPVPLTRAEITIPLGASWVPADIYNAFISDVIGARRMTVSLNEMTKRWRVDPNSFPGADAISNWGTSRVEVADIVEAAFNSTPVMVWDKHHDGTRTRNEPAEAEARAKIQSIREAFTGQVFPGSPAAVGGWAWKDEERAQRLEDGYNRAMNRIVKEEHDGSHLTFPGLARTVTFPDGSTGAINLTPARTAAVWRIIQNGNTLIDHVVGAGKAQPLDAKVLTPDGWTTMGRIAVGDMVVGRNGLPTRVVGVFPQGEKDIYRVTFSDGSSTECCDEHLWFTQNYRERGYSQRAAKIGKNWPSARGKVRSLAEIRATLLADHLGAKNHSIPMVEAVSFNSRPVPLDPYLVGVLIGDGSLRAKEITFSSADAEIIENVRRALPPMCEVRHRSAYDYAICFAGDVGYAKREAGNAGFRGDAYQAVRSHPVGIGLDQLGLRGKYSFEKRVPEVYLRNSTEVRIGILRGLMDTDGHCSKRGTSTEFATSSPGLADDVIDLVRSLGGVATKREKEIVGHRKSYTLAISMPPHINPFSLSRKARLVAPKSRYLPTRYIVSVDLVAKKEAQCIAVECPDHLYVTDDYVVTHNTWTSIMAVMEMKRLGQIRRPMFVVPNHMLHQFSHEFLQAYPGAKLLIATKEGMSAARRKEFAAKAASEKWDGIIITHSAFGRLRMKDEAYKAFFEDQIQAMEEAKMQAVIDEDKNSPTVKDLEKAKKSLQARLDKLVAKDKKDYGITFEELGVDHLTVDEAHLFKNLSFPTRHTRVRGISNKSESQRATDLFIKIQHLETSRPGRSTLFLTGTPLSNTMAEVYTMMRYLMMPRLKEYGIAEFDSWAQTFGLIDTKSELAPDGKGYRDTTSFSTFVNVPELSTLYGTIADTQTAESLKLPRPTLKDGKATLVESDLSFDERAALERVFAEMEALKGKKPEKGAPNFLSLFTKGMQLATDMRLVNPDAGFNPTGKIAKAINNIFRIWEQGNANPAAPNKAQVVFLDMGVPGSKAAATVRDAGDRSAPTGLEETAIDKIRRKMVEDGDIDESTEEAEANQDEEAQEAEKLLLGKFNLYADMKKRLVEMGIPAEQIAFIHDAKTDEAKAKMFEAVREGKIRVLIGSTGKMGVGTNVQKRLVALHHIDAPWRPADLEQRDGRILRQGNKNAEVQIFRYITLRSLDAYKWQVLDTKSNFIGQFRAGARGVRIAEDIDMPLPDAAQVKAAATGDPRFQEQADLSRQLRQLEAQATAHASSSIRAKSSLERLSSMRESLAEKLPQFEEDAAKAVDLSGDNFKITIDGDGDYTDRKKAGTAVRELIVKTAAGMWGSRSAEVKIGTISGMEANAFVRRTSDGIVVTAEVRGAVSYESVEFAVTEESQPVTLIQRFERLVREPARLAGETRSMLATIEKDIPKLEKSAVSTPFAKQADLVITRARLAELGAQLDPKKAEAKAEMVYVDQAMANLKKTSRTAAGVVDTSASAGKAEQMAEGLTPEKAAKAASDNMANAMRYAFVNRNRFATMSAEQLSEEIDRLVLQINKGILKEGALYRTEDGRKYPYTSVANLNEAHRQFVGEFGRRLSDPNADPVETAAWVEWRANLTDHFWADGVGKTSKVLAAIPLMKAGLPLPQYRDNKEMFAYSQPKPYVPNPDGSSYRDGYWERFLDYYRTLMPSTEQAMLDKRERKAREIMASPEWTQATIPDMSRDTEKQPGYGTKEWADARAYNTPEGEIVGYENGIDYLIRSAHAKVEGGVKTERKVFMLLGLPGAGKSTIARKLGEAHGAVHLVGDDAKLIIPEYDNGNNSGGVHEEASTMMKDVIDRQMKDGVNIIVEKLGSSDGSIMKMVDNFAKRGYKVIALNVDVPKALAMERAIGRWQRTGRAVPITEFDKTALNLPGLMTRLAERENVDETGRIAFSEARDGWEARPPVPVEIEGLWDRAGAPEGNSGVDGVGRGPGAARGDGTEGSQGPVAPGLSAAVSAMPRLKVHVTKPAGGFNEDLENDARDKVRTALKSGYNVVISPAVVKRTNEVLAETAAVQPNFIAAGTVSKMRNLGNGKVQIIVAATDGRQINVTVPDSFLFREDGFIRAFQLTLPIGHESGASSVVAFFNHTDDAVVGSQEAGLRATQVHELIHALYRGGKFSVDVWQRLVDHAYRSGALEMGADRMHEALGLPVTDDKRSMQDIYYDLYMRQGHSEDVVLNMLDQEAVAHFAELAAHGHWTADELAPVKDILDAIQDGSLASGKVVSVQPETVMAALDAAGTSQRKDFDSLGFYSQALEAAKRLKQAKGTPEQMLAQIKAAGVKEAEIKATGLDAFIEGQKAVTRDEIVRHLQLNRVSLKVARYGGETEAQKEEFDNAAHELAVHLEKLGNAESAVNDMLFHIGDRSDGGNSRPPRVVIDDAGIRLYEHALEVARAYPEAKWSPYSLDPSNPTYRETVLHLPASRTLEQYAADKGLTITPASRRIIESSHGLDDRDFRSGHFSEPNIIGHMMTSMTTHEGKPVFTIDQIQSDWGQKLRDGGVRNEAKIAELKARLDEAKAGFDPLFNDLEELARDGRKYEPAKYAALEQVPYYADAPVNGQWRMTAEAKAIDDKLADLSRRISLADAELRTAEASPPGHPLVNTTDQWTTTTLRHALRQAVAAGADYIAIPSGDTVLSYNPGDEHGMGEFYGKIVPKNLRNILSKMDKTIAPQRIETLDSPSGKTGLGRGFTLFPITPAVRESVELEGLPMFAWSSLFRKSASQSQSDNPTLAKRIEEALNGNGVRAGRELAQVDVAGSVSDAQGESAAEGRPAEAGAPGSRQAGDEAGNDDLAGSGSDWVSLVESIKGHGWMQPEAVAQRQRAQGFTTKGWHATTSDFDVPSARRRDFGFHVALGTPAAANYRAGTPSTALDRMNFLIAEGRFPGATAGASLMPVMVRAENTLRLNDPGRWISPADWSTAVGNRKGPVYDALRAVIAKYADETAAPGGSQGAFLDEVAAVLDDNDIDAAIYKNRIEALGRDSLFVWKPENVRSQFDLFDERADGEAGLHASRKHLEQDMNDMLDGLIEETVDTMPRRGMSTEQAFQAMLDPVAAPMLFAVGGKRSLSPAERVAINNDLRARADEKFAGQSAPALNKVITDLKGALGIVTTQGLWGVTVRQETANADGSTTVRSKRLRPDRRMRAMFRTRSGVVSLRMSRDISAIAHEGGHGLEQAIGVPLETLKIEHRAELEPLAYAGATDNLSEGFAEWFKTYITDRDGAAKSAPNFFNAFEDLIDGHDPKLLPMLIEVAAAYSAHVKKDPLTSLASDIVSTYEANSWRELAPEDISGKLATAYTGWVDALNPVNQLVRRLLAVADANGIRDKDGKPISLAVHENPYKLARLFADSYSRGRMWLENGVSDLGDAAIKTKGLHDALLVAFDGKSKWDKATYQKFGAYLISRRAIAEYDLLAKKNDEIAQIDATLEAADRARPVLAAQAQSDAAKRDRRNAQVIRERTLLQDRRRQLANATTADDIADLEFDIQEREIAVMAAESEADIAAKAANSSRERLSRVDQLLDRAKKERDRRANLGASRPPTLQPRSFHETVIAEAEAEHPKFKEASRIVYDWTHQLLTVRYQAGFLTKEQYDALSDRKGFYVPFQRDMSDVTPESSFGTNGPKKWSPFKKFDGSDRAIINPLEALSQTAYNTAQQIAFNDIVKSLRDVALRAGRDAGKILEPLTQKDWQQGANPDTFNRIYQTAVSLGIDPHDAHLAVQSMEHNFSDADIQMIWSPEHKGPGALPTLPMWENGERVLIRLNDPVFGQEVFDAINGMGKEARNILDQAMGAFSTGLRIGVTTHPDFMLRNLLRDMGAAWVVAGAVPGVAHARGLYHLTKNTDLMRLYNEVGGIMGGANVAATRKSKDRADVLALKSKGFHVLDWKRPWHVVEAVETAGRMGVFAQAYKQAKAYNPKLTNFQAAQEAAYVARDVIDFGRRGSKSAAMMRVVTFMNAHVQSMDKASRLFSAESDRGSVFKKQIAVALKMQNGTPLSAQEERMRADAIKAYVRLALLTGFLLAIYGMMAGDKDYEDIKDQTKHNHAWFKAFGTWFRLPKPFEFALPAMWIEIVMDKIAGRNEQMVKRLASSTLDTIAPPVVPQAVNIFAGVAANYDLFRKRPIIGAHLEKLDPSQQFDAYSSKIAIDMAWAIEKAGVPRDKVPSPKMIDFLFTSGGAYWGKEIQNIYGGAARALGYSNRETWKWTDAPLIRGVTGEPARQSRSTDEFWKLMGQGSGELARASAQYKDFIHTKGQPETAAAYLARLEPEERAYAYLMETGTAAEKRAHPLERLKQADATIRDIRKDMILDRLTEKDRKGKRDFDTKVRLSPDKQLEVQTILEKLGALEAWNTMVLMKRPGWEDGRMFDPKPLEDTLRASSREVYDLLQQRREKAKMQDWSTVEKNWPNVREQLLKDAGKGM